MRFIELTTQLAVSMAITFLIMLLIVRSTFSRFEDGDLSYMPKPLQNFADTGVACKGKKIDSVALAAYYCNYQDEDDKDCYLDDKGKKLRSLQEYLDDQAKFVTIAMDTKLNIPYATKVCIPELNRHFGHKLRFEVRDSGSNLLGMGYHRADIFVRSEIDSYDRMVNRKVTLYFEM